MSDNPLSDYMDKQIKEAATRVASDERTVTTKMSLILKSFLLLFCEALIVYLGTGYIQAEWNPFQWEEEARLAHVSITVIVYWLSLHVVVETK